MMDFIMRFPCFPFSFEVRDGDHVRECSPSLAHMVATIHANGRHHEYKTP